MNGLALYLAAVLIPAVQVVDIKAALFAGFGLGLIHLLVRPLLLLVALPVNLLSFGVFTVVIDTWLVMLMDLVRLRTAGITERYINIIGHDYIERGLPNFFDDFRNSMYASYTPEELREAIPRNTARCWCQLVPRGLPGAQIIFGLPEGRTEPHQLA